MLQPINLVFPEDLLKLPKSLLEEACVICGIPNDTPDVSLAEAVFDTLRNGEEEVKNKVFEHIKDKIFASRRAITWHRLPEHARELDIVTAMRERLGINPFERIIERNPDNLGATAQIVGACQYGEGRRYLLRYLVKVRVQRTFGLQFSTRTIGGLVSALLDLENCILEIRDDPKYVPRILREIAQLFDGTSREAIDSFRIADLIEPFGGKIGDMADALGGNLISFESRPELFFEGELTEEQISAISNVLIGINNYFENQDIECLINVLNESIDTLSVFEGVPFLAILLAGMEKLGLSVKELADVRSLPLLNALRPHLQYQGGFIRFPVNENGVVEYHTIRVGLQTNSISFRTFATEQAIDLLRKKILLEN
ncbi:hypothetical protein [Moorella sp. E306M]|uniref:hypothetical protein n=1 Tax=Moorella sp. E306M TaxID=2572683 RepID=UPI0010FFB78C|nr:hypothetical protein [Moorella sp. E306M]GEA17722.1 hypothetical protein E306M_08560 [Moorella sp. E306M]GEA17791.1 hypothetical protein E306M_09250 [Moorella sp. E306M]